MKYTLTSFLIIVFLSLAVFGLVGMAHDSDNCLFSLPGATPCAPGIMTVSHHIASYQSFLNVPLASGAMAGIIALLFAFCLALLLLFRPFIPRPPTLTRYFSAPSRTSVHDGNITRWLALFEHSPSF